LQKTFWVHQGPPAQVQAAQYTVIQALVEPAPSDVCRAMGVCSGSV
jgi:hypothetical protein